MRLTSVNNLRSTGINTEEWGGDNYFFSVMAGTVCGFELQETWVNSKEKQMLTERKIKRGIKIFQLKVYFCLFPVL